MMYDCVLLSVSAWDFSYARDFADPYLGHGIGPVPGYGVSAHIFRLYLLLVQALQSVICRTKY